LHGEIQAAPYWGARQQFRLTGNLGTILRGTSWFKGGCHGKLKKRNQIPAPAFKTQFKFFRSVWSQPLSQLKWDMPFVRGARKKTDTKKMKEEYGCVASGVS